MARFVRADAGPEHGVIYTDDTGKRFHFAGGARSWRNHNPGNLVPGEVSKRNGQIGTAGGFAVFPDEESGHRALLDSLKNKHGNKDLRQMIRVYAPKHENKTEKGEIDAVVATSSAGNPYLKSPANEFVAHFIT